jgi:hypothetical protein
MGMGCLRNRLLERGVSTMSVMMVHSRRPTPSGEPGRKVLRPPAAACPWPDEHGLPTWLQALARGGIGLVQFLEYESDRLRRPLPISVATLVGFEPTISTLKGSRAGPLHHRVRLGP